VDTQLGQHGLGIRTVKRQIGRLKHYLITARHKERTCVKWFDIFFNNELQAIFGAMHRVQVRLHAITDAFEKSLLTHFQNLSTQADIDF